MTRKSSQRISTKCQREQNSSLGLSPNHHKFIYHQEGLHLKRNGISNKTMADIEAQTSNLLTKV